MPASRDLAHLLRVMQPALDPRVFVFASVVPPIPEGVTPLATFSEAEGVTVILERDAATRLGLPYVYPCRLITLTVQSSLEAVGFLAAITAALAADGISVNPVAAYHHDHLFVPVERAHDALAALARLASTHALHSSR